MGIIESKARALNVLYSFGPWLHGTFGADVPDSAACCWVQEPGYRDAPVQRRFNQLYPTAPEPILRGTGLRTEVDGDERLRAGTPLLVLGPLTPAPAKRAYGSRSGSQDWSLRLSMRVAVWADPTTQTLDVPATVAQLYLATDQVGELLSWQDGHFPVYDHDEASPREHLLGWGMLATVGRPTLRDDALQSDWTLLLRLSIDGARP